MAAYVRVTFVLTGPDRGKTKKVKHYSFVNGECTVDVPRTGLAHAANYLSYFASYLKGSPEHLADLAASEEAVNGVLGNAPAGVQVGDADFVQSPEHRQAGPVPAAQDVNGGVPGDREEGRERASDSTTGLGPQDSGLAGKHAEPSGLNVSPLSRAITALDPEVDTNWTEGGLPAIAALAAFDPSLTRRVINEAAPGWNRAKARDAASLL